MRATNFKSTIGARLRFGDEELGFFLHQSQIFNYFFQMHCSDHPVLIVVRFYYRIEYLILSVFYVNKGGLESNYSAP